VIDRRLIPAAALAFVVSRGLVLLLLLCGSQMSFLQKVYSSSVWETRIELQAARVRPELFRVAMVGDTWFYRSIAMHGYDLEARPGEAPNWAFFPLYPSLVRLLSFTGDFAFDGMILSHLAFAAALVLLGSLLTRSGLDLADAERAIWYVAFFPTSYFFSLPMTESLFLALSAGAMLSAVCRRWWLAGILGGLAALTRAPGVLLALPLAILFLENRDEKRARALWLLLVPAGTALFMWHLWRVTGDSLAFVHVQRNWGRGTQHFWTPFVEFVRHPNVVAEPWNLIGLNVMVALLVLVAAGCLLMQRRWAFAAYAFASVLLPLSTGSFQSMARYAAVIFPFFAWLATLGRRPLVDRVILGIGITLLGCLLAFVILRVDFALA
jgi:Gpi18-like mannosyltransferase